MGRAADRDARRKSNPTWARSSPRTISARHIRYRHRIERASWSSATNLWTVEAVQDRQRRARDLHREFPLDVPGLLSPFRGLHPAMDRHGQVQGPHRPSASLAGGYRARGQEGGGDRLGRHRRDADSGDRRQMRPCHHAAALADLFQGRPQRHRTRRDAAAAPGQGGMDPRDRAPQDPVRAGPVHPPLVHRTREGQAGAPERHSRGARSRFGGHHREAFHAEIPAVAAAHRLRSRFRPVPGGQERQGIGGDRRDRPVRREPASC